MDAFADRRDIAIHSKQDFTGMRVAGRLAAEVLDMITDVSIFRGSRLADG
jgi:methionine aminopeptidase